MPVAGEPSAEMPVLAEDWLRPDLELAARV